MASNECLPAMAAMNFSAGIRVTRCRRCSSSTTRFRGTVRGAILEPAATGWDLFRRVPGFRQLGGYVRHSMMPMPARLETFNLLHRLGEDSLLEAEFRASVDPDGPLKRQRAVWESAAAASLLNRMLGYDWKFTLADSDLPKVRAPRNSPASASGIRFSAAPLTDFSLSIPPHWKLKGLKLRWFFKRSAARIPAR